MEFTLWTTFIVVTLAPLMYYIYTVVKRPKNFPPGPPCIPIIGSLHRLSGLPHLQISKIAEKYGNVFSLQFLHLKIVCVNGYEALTELHKHKAKEFCDRPKLYTIYPLKEERAAGITQAPYGPIWEANRKMFHKAIRDVSRKNSIENVIKREVPFMIKEISKNVHSEGILDPTEIIKVTSLNIIASFVFGDIYEYSDEKMKRLIKINSDFFNSDDLYSDPFFFLPSLFPLLGKLWTPASIKTFLYRKNKLADFCMEEIQRHKITLDPKSPRDFADYYLIHMKEETVNGKPILDEEELQFSLYDFFQSATGSLTTTMQWAVLHIARHQHVQKKVQDEIDQVLGLDREPNFEDRFSMPYTKATLYEVQRFSSTVPISMLHSPLKDAELDGYNIPKGTLIIPNQYSSNFQADKWKNPTQFDPENFLDENGQFKSNEALMLFGGGFRLCPGISFTKQELFLFFVSLLQRYEIKPKDREELSDAPMLGIALYPKSCEFKFTERC